MIPKRGAVAGAITVVALVLLINFKTPDQLAADTGLPQVAIVEPGATATADPTTTTATDPAATADPGASGAPAATGTPAPTAGATATVDGPVVSTRFGPVQVEVVVVNGAITDIVALQMPSGGRSGRISQIAFPILQEEALTAQSANVDTVSGATYTSNAYERSLQAALDQAGV
jgi:uncharacterized protein with FMN-binding domain